MPVEENIREFLRVIDERRKAGAVLIHCMRGVHRTGAYTAIYRMEFNGWSNSDAIAEMVERGYDTLDDDPDIFQYLGSYVPRRPRPAHAGPAPAADSMAASRGWRNWQTPWT